MARRPDGIVDSSARCMGVGVDSKVVGLSSVLYRRSFYPRDAILAWYQLWPVSVAQSGAWVGLGLAGSRFFSFWWVGFTVAKVLKI